MRREKEEVEEKVKQDKVSKGKVIEVKKQVRDNKINKVTMYVCVSL